MAEDKLSMYLNIAGTALLVTGTFGALAKPQTASLTLVAIFTLLVFFFIIEKFKRVDVNEDRIRVLERRTLLEARFSSIERELAEQKGKLSVVIKK
jgi:hypothetical protein